MSNRTPEEIVRDILTYKYVIKTVNAAVANLAKVNTFGPDSIQYNLTGLTEELETSTVVVEARVTIARILQIYQSGFEMSLMGKNNLPNFISDLEKLIVALVRMKSPNRLPEDILIGDTRVTLKELINLYSVMTSSNQEEIEKLISKTLVEVARNDGLLVIGNSGLSSTTTIKTGEAFLNENLNINNAITNHDRKRKLERLRDGY